MAPTRIIFFGTGEFALQILQSLFKNHLYHICCVITQPPRAVGRVAKIHKSATHAFALLHHIPVETPEKLKTDEFRSILRAYSPDIFIVAQYGRIIPADILAIAPHGALNVHGSLLPRWRGAAPVHAAIAAGDTETGITFMVMDAQMDHGPLISKHPCTVAPTDTTPELIQRLGALGAQKVSSAIEGYMNGTLIPTPQQHNSATYTALLVRETGAISAETQSAIEIERLVRALVPWPGVMFTINGSVIKIVRCHVDTNATIPAGQLVFEHKLVKLGTCDGTILMDELLPAGKKIMSSAAFQNGYAHLSGLFISEPTDRRNVFQTEFFAR